MPLKFATIAILLASLATTAPVKPTGDVIKANGNIRITPKFHGSFQIQYRGLVIEVDPVSAARYTQKANLVLITHAHPDHFDKTALKNLNRGGAKLILPEASGAEGNRVVREDGTYFVAPESITSELYSKMESGIFYPLSSGQTFAVEEKTGGSDKKTLFHVQAVPMYNVERGPKAGQKYHPKGDGNGYILTLGGKRIYITGDTEATPEMKKLKNIDIAFIPMNLPFTMTSEEAAEGVRAFKPKIVYPYHYRYPFNKTNNNPQRFAAALKGTGIRVRLREWYPKAAVGKAVAEAKK